jgi:hypothetical protein
MENITLTIQIIDWLKEHQLIKHALLEKECNMPQGCIYKIINGKIDMPSRHVPVLAESLKKYGFKADENYVSLPKRKRK